LGEWLLVKPVLQALVVAERVYEDKSTGKKVIAGTFNRCFFSKKPQVQEVALPDGTQIRAVPGGNNSGSPFAYLSLTDICDGTKLQCQFVNLTKNEVLLATEVNVSAKDRLAMIEVVLPLPVLPIGEPGLYALEVLCEGAILGSWRITGVDLDAAVEEK
jgi:hypothetical protein